jgi:lysophospholipase L1-like esterase
MSSDPPTIIVPSQNQLHYRLLTRSSMKFKQRSHDTYLNVHIPQLENTTSPIRTILLGDSMIERLKTTGQRTKTSNLPNTFNAGVGGDKIENVLYRIDLGLLDLLKKRQEKVKLWVVMIGTNNLTSKRGLRAEEIERYKRLLQVLFEAFPESKAIVCEIFKRKDVKDELVEDSNDQLKEMVRVLNVWMEKEYVLWLDAPAKSREGMGKERLLVDHVHLNEEGYEIWDEVLSSRIQQLLESTDSKE